MVAAIIQTHTFSLGKKFCRLQSVGTFVPFILLHNNQLAKWEYQEPCILRCVNTMSNERSHTQKQDRKTNTHRHCWCFRTLLFSEHAWLLLEPLMRCWVSICNGFYSCKKMFVKRFIFILMVPALHKLMHKPVHTLIWDKSLILSKASSENNWCLFSHPCIPFTFSPSLKQKWRFCRKVVNIYSDTYCKLFSYD